MDARRSTSPSIVRLAQPVAAQLVAVVDVAVAGGAGGRGAAAPGAAVPAVPAVPGARGRPRAAGNLAAGGQRCRTRSGWSGGRRQRRLVGGGGGGRVVALGVDVAAGGGAANTVSSMEIINLLLAAGVDVNPQLNMRRPSSPREDASTIRSSAREQRRCCAP